MTKEENEKRLAYLKSIVLSMPDKPGSYQFYDNRREKGGNIIYVGKAKSLKRRVSSYFHKEVDRFKTKVLVSKIKISAIPLSTQKKMRYCLKTPSSRSITHIIMFYLKMAKHIPVLL